MRDAPVMPSLDQINAYRWEDIARRAAPPICHEIASCLFKEAVALEGANDEIGAIVYRFLGQLAFMALDPSNQDAPMTPTWFTPSRRSAGLTDYDDDALKIVRSLMETTSVVAFRARLADLLWILEKDHKAAARASEDYLDTFKIVDAADKWAWDEKGVRRGMDIARVLGKKKPLFLSYVEYLETRLREVESSCDDAYALHLLHLLADHRAGKHEESARIAEAIGVRLNSSGSPDLARNYFDQATRFFQFLQDMENARRVIRVKGDSFFDQATSEAGTRGYLTASGHLAQAVECFKQGQASSERVDETHRMLLEWQAKSTSELKSFSHETDVSQLVEKARGFVRGKTLKDAIFAMSFYHPLIDLDELRKRVIDNLQRFPLSSLFGASIMDRAGRITARRPSGFTTDPDEQKEFVESEMFHQAQQFVWPMRAQAYIEPCRLEIWDLHRPELHDLEFVVTNNPLIPHGHEPLYLKALLAGFRGDFDIVVHFLVPQVEECIRHVLTRAGHIAYKIDSVLLQQAGMLGKLLNMPETKAFFGEDAAFELRGLLIEKFGYDLRNNLAHGFLTYHECWSPAAVNLWWLMLRFLCVPFAREGGFFDRPETDQPTEPDAKPTS